MSELIPYDPKLVKAIIGGAPGEMLKPLQTVIFLLDSFVAGTSHLKDKSVLEDMKAGDKLTMQRQTNNEYDKWAIALIDGKGRKAGYVPQRDNIVLARLMDAGKYLEAEVREIKPHGRFWEIAIGISMVDF